MTSRCAQSAKTRVGQFPARRTETTGRLSRRPTGATGAIRPQNYSAQPLDFHRSPNPGPGRRRAESAVCPCRPGRTRPELRWARPFDGWCCRSGVRRRRAQRTGSRSRCRASRSPSAREAIARTLQAPAIQLMAERSSVPADSGDHLVAIGIVRSVAGQMTKEQSPPTCLLSVLRRTVADDVTRPAPRREGRSAASTRRAAVQTTRTAALLRTLHHGHRAMVDLMR
jgi:hypothetical protein